MPSFTPRRLPRYNLKEVAYFIPETNESSHPLFEGQPTAIQINDVDLDRRGFAYASDRIGTGLFIWNTPAAA